MTRAVVQIYEVQTPVEAEALMELGVDHIGSVLMSPEFHQPDSLLETISLVSRNGRKSCMIPLFLETERISRALERYGPDIVHFCEVLSGGNGNNSNRDAAFLRQRTIRERFPEIRIMRSIPIGQIDRSHRVPTLDIARLFEPISDFFLTDTLVINDSKNLDGDQPVNGFVGITGKTCDWDIAAKLVNASRIPVILAGGISPENVAEGIRRVQPAGIDSCTLTNAVDEKGRAIRFRKDPEKVRRLVAEVRRAEHNNYTEMEA